MNRITHRHVLSSIITTFTLVTTVASATGLPNGASGLQQEVADRYVQSEVSCLNGKASVAARTRQSGIERITFEPLLVRSSPDSKLLPVTCADGGFLLSGKKLTTQEVATYAMETPALVADRSDWVLILTPTNQPATYVPDFTSEVACEQAANIWQGRGPADRDRPGLAVCIQR